jgi:hypothetical protein
VTSRSPAGGCLHFERFSSFFHQNVVTTCKTTRRLSSEEYVHLDEKLKWSLLLRECDFDHSYCRSRYLYLIVFALHSGDEAWTRTSFSVRLRLDQPPYWWVSFSSFPPNTFWYWKLIKHVVNNKNIILFIILLVVRVGFSGFKLAPLLYVVFRKHLTSRYMFLIIIVVIVRKL